jgi:cytidine deaminase
MAHGLTASRSPRRAAARSLMPKTRVSAAARKKLEQAAVKVMKNAHAPYSNFRVGAAILLADGKIVSGCNVENASYGMTNCAERTAIFSAVARLGPKIEIRAVAVANDHEVACSPCGACRQVIYEFGPDATIFFQGARGPKQAHISDLLPEGFRLQ